MSDRKASVRRATAETEVTVNVAIDGRGEFSGGTGVGFLDHMLEIGRASCRERV